MTYSISISKTAECIFETYLKESSVKLLFLALLMVCARDFDVVLELKYFQRGVLIRFFFSFLFFSYILAQVFMLDLLRFRAEPLLGAFDFEKLHCFLIYCNEKGYTAAKINLF